MKAIKKAMMSEFRQIRYSFIKVLLRPQGLLLLLAFALMPLVIGIGLYNANRDVLRGELAELCNSFLTSFPTQQYIQFANQPELNVEQQKSLLDVLKSAHITNPKIQYIYTLRGVGDQWQFVLDTLQDNETAAIVNKRFPQAMASEWGEQYDYPPEFLDSVAVFGNNQTWVDPDIFDDAYGQTIGCIVPIAHENGTLHALGIDYKATILYVMRDNIRRYVIIGTLLGFLLMLLSLRFEQRYLTIKQRLLEKLHTLSTTDMLTNIQNRRAFFEGAEKLIDARSEDAFVSVAIVDLDHFKAVNDTYGHDVGDQVLMLFAKLLNHYCNPRKFVIGRIGGEEFAVCNVSKHPEELAAQLEHLRSAVKKASVDTKDGTIHFSFSGGYVTRKGTEPVELPDLLRLADAALYESKDTGRDRLTAYSE